MDSAASSLILDPGEQPRSYFKRCRNRVKPDRNPAVSATWHPPVNPSPVQSSRALLVEQFTLVVTPPRTVPVNRSIVDEAAREFWAQNFSSAASVPWPTFLLGLEVWTLLLRPRPPTTRTWSMNLRAVNHQHFHVFEPRVESTPDPLLILDPPPG